MYRLSRRLCTRRHPIAEVTRRTALAVDGVAPRSARRAAWSDLRRCFPIVTWGSCAQPNPSAGSWPAPVGSPPTTPRRKVRLGCGYDITDHQRQQCIRGGCLDPRARSRRPVCLRGPAPLLAVAA